MQNALKICLFMAEWLVSLSERNMIVYAYRLGIYVNMLEAMGSRVRFQVKSIRISITLIQISESDIHTFNLERIVPFSIPSGWGGVGLTPLIFIKYAFMQMFKFSLNKWKAINAISHSKHTSVFNELYKLRDVLC